MNRSNFNLKCFVLSAVALIVMGIVAAIAFIYSGLFDVAADRPHYALERWAFATTRQHSVAARAENIEVPKTLDEPGRLENGARLYHELCAHCHLRPGAEPNPVHRGLNPQPPLLDEWSATPAYTFLIVKHGVRSTGMPAWSPTLDDSEIWDVVAFQRVLPDMSAQDYEAAVPAAGEEGDGHDHEH